MRALVRTIINLTLLIAVLAFDARLTTLKAYQHASRDGRIAMLVVPVVAAFVMACIVLYVVPSKAQLEKRRKAKQPQRPAYSIAGSGRGRRR